jgi:hypothetical protein
MLARMPNPNGRLPSIEQLCKLFDYEPQTGVLRWKVRDDVPGMSGWNTKYAGKPAGNASMLRRPSSRKWYHAGMRVRIDGKNYGVHRLIWAMKTGEWPEHSIDHINRDPLDNRWVNLREATAAEQCQNRSRPTASTPYNRVRKVRGLYYVMLGPYRTPEEAHASLKAIGYA